MEDIIIPESSPKPNYKKDIRSILLLFALYILQGVPLGLILTVPFLLQSQGVEYKDQAKFSLAFWPFSLKVLYAPIIDAVYWKRMGRRKSWLIPLQYLIALFLLVLVFKVDELFRTKNVTALTAMFFMLNFLAASQDVAVDGWALTMLSPENVGYASTCNAVGQTLGFVFGYSGFMALDSAKFANKFRSVPLDQGLVTLPQFLCFWAIIFAITTTLILIFKKEAKESPEVTESHMNVLACYRSLWKILKLRNIQLLMVFLLTARIGLAATESMTALKLVEAGVPKETLAFFSVPLIPLKLLLPLLITKWVVGPNPMKLYIATIPVSLCFGIIYPLIVFWLPWFKEEGTEGSGPEYSTWIYIFLFIVAAAQLIPAYTRFVAGMGFSAKISDPIVGGTYMTLINTISNVGGTWPSTVAFWLVSYVEIPLKDCSERVTDLDTLVTTTTNSSYNATVPGGNKFVMDYSCISKIDGYYVESVFCVTVGFFWLIWGAPTILRLQKRPRHTWKIAQD